MSYTKKIILAGFMGTGKTSVGKKLASILGYSFFDTDEWIEEKAKKSISQIFDQQGEKVFRQLERQAITRALRCKNVVISVGGGSVCFEANFNKLNRAGSLILLTASTSTILKRTKQHGERPLLAVANPKEKIEELMQQRAPFYQRITWKVMTDGKNPIQIAQKIAEQLKREGNALWVSLGARSYPLYFQKNGLKVLPELLSRHCPSSRYVVLTNTKLNRLYGKQLFNILQKTGEVKFVVIPDGEKYKNLETIQKIYSKLLKFRADRKTPLIAFGGGVVGDMGGYVAASFLRGIPYVQIPTTLLAQVDSSIGGKTGVDLPEGKNLVGAFYQPRFVLMEESFLKTLSPRQFRCGMAEVIKYAAIFDQDLFSHLEKNMDRLLSHQGKGLEDIIRRCCEWKAWVVEKDEHETLGIRSKLNFGHTLGHAIESLTFYQKYTHGEAVAMGMVFAAEKSVSETSLSQSQLERLIQLIFKSGLPTKYPNFSPLQYRRAMAQDKKRLGQDINFVYLQKIGRAVMKSTALENLLS